MTCPTEQLLMQFAVGDVPHSEIESIGDHLEGCSDCQAKMARIESEASGFVDQLRNSARASDDEVAESPLNDVMAIAMTMGNRKYAESAKTESFPGVPKLEGYRILERVAQGGMGTVFKAIQTDLKRLVAIKVINFHRLPQLRERFARESVLAGKLDHPNLIRCHDAGVFGNSGYLVMEFLVGSTLQEIVSTSGPLDSRVAMQVASESAQALSHLHSHGMVHRDVKPSNIMVCDDGTIKLLDLGLALCDSNELSPSITEVGQLLGTPDFMSPEQCRDSREADIRSDIYSLGATLHFLLTGRVLFSGATPTAKLAAILNDDVPSISDFRDDVPPEFVQVVERMLSRPPEDRFTTPDEVQSALAECDEPKPSVERTKVLSHGLKRGEPTIMPTNSSKYVGGFMASIVAVLAIVVAFSILPQGHNDAKSAPETKLVARVATAGEKNKIEAIENEAGDESPTPPPVQPVVDDEDPPALEEPPKGQVLDGVVIDDTGVLTTFTSLGKVRRIFMTKRFMNVHQGLPKPDGVFSSFDFYVLPDCIVDQESLNEAYKNRSKNGDKSYMDVTVALSKQRIKDDASHAINSKWPKAAVTSNNIQIVTAHHPKFYVVVPGQKDTVVIESAPDGKQMGNMLAENTIRITGAEKSLEAFAKNGRVYFEYTLTGHRVKQNIIAGKWTLFFKMGFHRELKGDSSFELLKKHRGKATSAGIGFKFLSLGASNIGGQDSTKLNNWVTRNEMRAAVHHVMRSAQINEWIEIPDDHAAFDQQRNEIELAMHEFLKTVDIEVKNAGDKDREEFSIKGDIRPDLLGSLKSVVNQKRNGQNTDDTSVKYGDLEVGKKTSSISSGDVSWDQSTGPDGNQIWIPKSLQIYQINAAAYNHVYSKYVAKTHAKWMSVPGITEALVCVKSLEPKIEERRITGADKVIDVKGVSDEAFSLDGDANLS